MTHPLVSPIRAATLALVAAAALTPAPPARADVATALDSHILPGFARFATAADALASATATDCRPAALAPAYQATFDAWMVVGDLRLGPSETGALSVAFWPDPRGATPKTLAALIATEDPAGRDPAAYADVSIAARGLFALDRLLFDPDFAAYAPGSYACALAATIAADLATQARALSDGWSGPFATTLRSAGDAGNATYLTKAEAQRALYTQILTSLAFTADKRLGLPLGTFDEPRPARAEARRSARPLPNVVQAAEAAHALATALAGAPLPAADAALARLHDTAARIPDPALQDITDPQARLRVELLQSAVRDLAAAIETDVGSTLGIAPGFNAQDGD